MRITDQHQFHDPRLPAAVSHTALAMAALAAMAVTAVPHPVLLAPTAMVFAPARDLLALTARAALAVQLLILLPLVAEQIQDSLAT